MGRREWVKKQLAFRQHCQHTLQRSEARGVGVGGVSGLASASSRGLRAVGPIPGAVSPSPGGCGLVAGKAVGVGGGGAGLTGLGSDEYRGLHAGGRRAEGPKRRRRPSV